ncbi:MAG: hypothetical protein V3U99_04925 [Alphaproteobacteria bacterium]
MAGQHSTAGLARAIAAQALHTDDLMAIPGVVGTAVGLGANGEAVVKIYTAAGGIAGLPRTLDGVGVRVEVTGRFFAVHHVCDHFGGPPDSDKIPCEDPPVEDPPPDEGGTAVDPTARFTRPVPIGVSSGTTRSITDFSCSTGTLGARLKSGNKVYALSNNHVYALENVGVVGDDIVQPGPVDTDPVCENIAADKIGDLAAYVDIVFSTSANTNNRVDAAIAETIKIDSGGGVMVDSVGTATPADGYGEPKTNILVCGSDDCLGLSVQKYGRTSGLTKGTVSGIIATINIGYSTGTARFVDQIVVSGNKGGFIKSGDSGSLLVVDDAGDPDDRRPVGLLFAGSQGGKTAIANQIGDVLSELDDVLGGGASLSVDGD